MGLSYLSSITSHFLNVLRDGELQCVAQPNFNALSNIVNALGTFPTALVNNLLHRFGKRFQRVEKRCNAFSMHFRLISYAQGNGYKTPERRLVLLTIVDYMSPSEFSFSIKLTAFFKFYISQF